MARRAKRDLTARQQLARGPMDLPFLMLSMLLLSFGLIMVFSSSYASAYYDETVSTPLFYFLRQTRYAIMGIIVMYIISRIDYQYWRGFSVIFLIISILCLIAVLTPAGVTINDSKRWLVIGPVQFQPSELAKFAVIVYFAARLSKRNNRKVHQWNRKHLGGRIMSFLDRTDFLELIPYVLILGIISFLMLKEPHMSGTILILVAGAAVLFAAGIKLYWFIIGGGITAIGIFIIIKSTDYMTQRIALWQNPWSDPLNTGFQTIQSLLAIGSGGLFGLGFGKSRQKFLFLPEPENDFIFSIVVEELGFVGACIVLLLFILLFIRGYWLAIHARDRFGSLTITGITTLLAVQVFLNIGVVTNFIPNTGISLPLFSFGGTALIIQLAEIGLILSISRQIPPPKKEEQKSSIRERTRAA